MDPREEATEIKIKNVIDMAINFSAMNRVFEEGSKHKIAQVLEDSFNRLSKIDSKDCFEKVHSEFCEWFMKNVYTAEKVLKNKKIKESRNASYGQAAKVFNVSGKVYFYYCHLPSCKSAEILLPMLHAAVDTLMMKNLKEKYPVDNIKAKSVEAVNKVEYVVLQKLVAKHIEDEFKGLILPVHYDDIMWYRLNRRTY